MAKACEALSAGFTASFFIALSVIAPSQTAARTETVATVPSPRIVRGYVDGRFGQLHYAMSTPSLPPSQRRQPLILLHQTANSLAEFGPLISTMGQDRVTIAFDTPGYGGSDAPLSRPRIEDYAEAIADGLKALGYSDRQPVDVMGNHTAAFVATALANQHPKMVRRMALVGVFVVSDEELASYRNRLKFPASSAEVFHTFCEWLPRLEANYTQLGAPDDDWGYMRADSLLSGRLIRSREYGHAAAYEYAGRVRAELPKVRQPVLLMAVTDKIGEATKRSASLFQNATLLDLPHITAGTGVDGLFLSQTAEVAAVLRKYLDRDGVGNAKPK